ncbi:hypothetical protein [Streptomyces agglomeratus]|uniref:hypothetical protein n=1 Tax=Streptomyces agglomeratus TaxID=285458 RepID=UPI00114D2F5F|nr:hypothetical protein [Streptomyces agglomeratus]
MTSPPSSQPLPADHRRLLGDLAELLDTPQLVVYGGAARDLLIARLGSPKDVDVAAGPLSRAAECRERLLEHPDVEHVGEARDYWIRMTEPVIMFDVRWRGMTLDINFLDDCGKIGHFDVECVRWEHPAGTFVDPYGVTERKETRSFSLVSSIDAENPVLLLNRLVKLSAKYDVDYTQAGELAHLAGELVKAASAWNSDDGFHGMQAEAAHARALATSVQRARAGRAFLQVLLDSGVIACRNPMLAVALSDDPSAVIRLARTNSPEAFWHLANSLTADRTSLTPRI